MVLSETLLSENGVQGVDDENNVIIRPDLPPESMAVGGPSVVGVFPEVMGGFYARLAEHKAIVQGKVGLDVVEKLYGTQVAVQVIDQLQHIGHLPKP
jgi:hypothetical protein